MTTESPRWFKSSYSNNGGECVEVAVNLVATHRAAARDIVSVRDSKARSGPVLALSATAFAGFVAGVKSGELAP